MKTTIIILYLTLLASIVSSQQACNGYPELCNRLYSDVAYPTTHNAYAFIKNPASNQNYDIPTQLKDGIRGFMLDALFPANNSKEVHLCHHSCDLLDAGPAKDTLSQIVTWLGNNPNEVITILWENAGKVPATTFNDFYTQSGLGKFAHFQPNGQAWPTLAKMIESGKRVVNFVDTGANSAVQWLMPEYDYVFETPFQIADLNSFLCTVDRPKNQQRPLYVLNHFIYGVLPPPFSSGGDQIDLPQPDKANITNSASLAGHAQQCQQTFNRIPNYVAVDFYDQGNDGKNVLSVAADLNRVTYVPKTLGDGNAKDGTTQPKNAAQPGGDLRFIPILGLVGAGTLAMFVL